MTARAYRTQGREPAAEVSQGTRVAGAGRIRDMPVVGHNWGMPVGHIQGRAWAAAAAQRGCLESGRGSWGLVADTGSCEEHLDPFPTDLARNDTRCVARTHSSAFPPKGSNSGSSA